MLFPPFRRLLPLLPLFALPVLSSDWKLDLEQANTLLSEGKYTDAIHLYDKVIRIIQRIRS